MKKIKVILQVIVRILISVLNPRGRHPKPGVSKPLHDDSSRNSHLPQRTGNSSGSPGRSALTFQAHPSPVNLLGIGLIVVSVLQYYG